jgi:hypothetical protein
VGCNQMDNICVVLDKRTEFRWHSFRNTNSGRLEIDSGCDRVRKMRLRECEIVSNENNLRNQNGSIEMSRKPIDALCGGHRNPRTRRTMPDLVKIY